MSQLPASFAGSPGSRRRLRPRIWRTATSAATAVMSTSTLTGGQSQPSPSSPRVPNSTRISPSASSRVAHAVHACELNPPSACRSTTSPSPASRRRPWPNSGQPASAASASSRRVHQSASPGRTANVSPVTSAARDPTNRSSAPRAASSPRAPPVSASGESSAWRGGCSESHSTTARRPRPARLVLAGQRVAHRQRLGGGVQQHPVDLAADAPDALARQREAEVAQRTCSSSSRRGGLGARVRAQAAQRVVLQQHDPVVDREVGAVLLAARRVVGRRDGRARAASAARRRPGAAGGARAPPTTAVRRSRPGAPRAATAASVEASAGHRRRPAA